VAGARIPLEQPWADRWLRLIDARFGEHLTRVDLRRREVIRVLSSRPDGRATFDEIATLTPELARTYAQKSRMALRHDVSTLMLMGLIQIPTADAVRTSAFKLFYPKPPPRPSLEEAVLLTRILATRAPHLLGVVDRLRDGEPIPPDEQLEVTDALMSEVSRSGQDKRGLTAEGEAIFNLPHLFEPRE
jgi:hypothetical protein